MKYNHIQKPPLFFSVAGDIALNMGLAAINEAWPSLKERRLPELLESYVSHT